MHIAAAEAVQHRLIPALRTLHASLARRADEWADIVKVGRTHMMDAVPVTLGQEFAAWARQVELGIDRLEGAMPRLLSVPQGGTAVGTGLNRHRDFDRVFCERLAALTGLAFTPNPNKFEGMGAHDAFVELSGVLNVLAVSLNKLGNDIRLLGSGPRSGLSELTIPADGLSSSIMPGKTNPTQSEALTMVCAQVMGNHVAITIGAAQSFLELNVFKPLIIHNVLQSAGLLADAAESFAHNMVDKLEPARERIAREPGQVADAGDRAQPADRLRQGGQDRQEGAGREHDLRDAADALGFVSPEDFDRWVVPGRHDRARRHAGRVSCVWPSAASAWPGIGPAWRSSRNSGTRWPDIAEARGPAAVGAGGRRGCRAHAGSAARVLASESLHCSRGLNCLERFPRHSPPAANKRAAGQGETPMPPETLRPEGPSRFVR